MGDRVEVPKVVRLADGGERCMACPEPGEHSVVVLGLVVGYCCDACADHVDARVDRR